MNVRASSGPLNEVCSGCAVIVYMFCTVEKTGSRSSDARIEVGRMKLRFLRREAVSCRIILPQFDARLE